MRALVRLAVGVGVLVGIVAIGLVGLRTYLSSDSAKRQLEQKLGAFMGARVKVDKLDAGPTSTTFNLSVYEPAGTAEGTEPLISVERVETDLTLLDLARGDTMPRRVKLIRPHLKLHYDRLGNSLSSLPQPPAFDPDDLPEEVTVEDGSLTLVREGSPDFQLTGVTALLRRKRAEGVFTAGLHVADGELSGSGKFDLGAEPLRMQLKLSARSIAVSQLPQNSLLPPGLTGKLDGHADVDIVVNESGTEIHGDGEAIATQPAMAGRPVQRIKLKLVNSQGRFRFEKDE